MAGCPKVSSVELFKTCARKSYGLIYQEICGKIRTRKDLAHVCCSPKTITKKALMSSYINRYHELGAYQFVRLTIEQADTVMDDLVASSKIAEVRLFLEDNHSVRA